MKNSRQNLILKLVSEYEISTQEELQKLLLEHGCKVTQATVSRDINELALLKTCTSAGQYKYTVPKLTQSSLADNGTFYSILTEGVVSVDYALNTVVIKCHTGMAQAVCAKLDSTGIENVVGTLAGDDTIFILMRSERDAARLLKELELVINI
ncbi:transcriptional regulator, ArgR family [Ruminococcaceae bacterium FB2012]|nr:transcriptional regulator, ArgR family [Ruminococcaceae bacterium FB2012]